MNTQRISHIGILVHDADAAVKFWTENMGFHKFDDMLIDVEGIRSVFISIGGTWDEMVIEIMEPLNKDDMTNMPAKRLASKGEGFYHLCLDVDDIDASAEEIENNGMVVYRRDAISEAHSRRWLMHPKDTNGVLVEGQVKL